MTRIDEVVDRIYRIATSVTDYSITFNQFLIEDERPALIHTGMAPMYNRIPEAIRQVMDPGRLAYIILVHFEGDECGDIEPFMAHAPNAQLIGCELSARLKLCSLISFTVRSEFSPQGSRSDAWLNVWKRCSRNGFMPCMEAP